MIGVWCWAHIQRGMKDTSVSNERFQGSSAGNWFGSETTICAPKCFEHIRIGTMVE